MEIFKVFKFDVRAIYLASTHRNAVVAFKHLRARWQRICPKAVECLERDMDELLSFLTIPIVMEMAVPANGSANAENAFAMSLKMVIINSLILFRLKLLTIK